MNAITYCPIRLYLESWQFFLFGVGGEGLGEGYQMLGQSKIFYQNNLISFFCGRDGHLDTTPPPPPTQPLPPPTSWHGVVLNIRINGLFDLNIV